MFKEMWSVLPMSLTESQIVDVALRVNSDEFIDPLEIPLGVPTDVAIVVDAPMSIDVLEISVPTVNIVATNTGPRGPQGDSGQWLALTQNEYDQLNPPDPEVLYVIIQ